MLINIYIVKTTMTIELKLANGEIEREENVDIMPFIYKSKEEAYEHADSLLKAHMLHGGYTKCYGSQFSIIKETTCGKYVIEAEIIEKEV